jgi:uncharacterized protein YqgC (DUF456 family)
MYGMKKAGGSKTAKMGKMAGKAAGMMAGMKAGGKAGAKVGKMAATKMSKKK